MPEEISGIEQVVADIADRMGRKLDDHSIQLDGVRRKLDEQEVTLYEHTAILRQHSRDIQEIKTRLTNVDGKIDQILALLTRKSEQ